MARKTYYNLKHNNGHLEKGDRIILHGIEYEVVTYPHLYLHAVGLNHDMNDSVFRHVFKMTRSEKVEWAKQFHSTGEGFFPEFEKEEDFKNFIIDIFERPIYKTGEYVTVLNKEKDYCSYPFGFTGEMAKLSGRTFKITSIERAAYDIETGEYELCNGDIHSYALGDTCYAWHISMFRKATEEEILAAKGIKSDDTGSVSISTHDSCADSQGIKSVDYKFDIMPAEEFEKPLYNSDCVLRLPKNTNKTPHINL